MNLKNYVRLWGNRACNPFDLLSQAGNFLVKYLITCDHFRVSIRPKKEAFPLKNFIKTKLNLLAILWLAMWVLVMAVPANADSLGDAARAYQSGNYQKAFELLKPLAEQGNAAAQYNLAFMYERGKWVYQDYTTAAKWYRKAADQGHANAQFFLGMMYQDGIGISQNHANAETWFRKAAQQGMAEAQFNLGYMYSEGKGVSQDHREADKWYRKAAEQGHSKAQYNLGNRYRVGQGVSQDHREAVKWYRKAAEQGHSKAQFNLGLLYAGGKAIRLDAFLAYKWLSLSTPGLPPGRDRDFANKLLKIIRENMPNADLVSADKMVQEWEAQHKRR